MPLSLSDSELETLMTAARPLSMRDRDSFLRDVYAALAKYEVVGEGVINRVIRETQRKYFDPPQFHSGGGKYNR